MLSPEHNFLAPDTILQGRYRIMRRIGQGGMGAVYEALDSTISSLVAVKETFATTDEQREAFHREAKLLANLHHEAFPHVTHHFVEGDGQYLVMELIAGNDLWELLRIRETPFPQEKVLEWADQLLDALHELHTSVPPIIHRDIKPPNMKLTARGKVKLLDFGIAKGSVGHMTLSTSDAHSVVGYTPHFAPLEQSLRSDRRWVETFEILNADAVAAILNTRSDARSDLYSLGATLYHLITNQLPSDATTRALAVWSGRPDPVAAADQINSQVSPAVAAVLAQAMSLERQDRPASAEAMRQALRDAARLPSGPHPVTEPAGEEDHAQTDRKVEVQHLTEVETLRRAETERLRRETEEIERRERKEQERQAAEAERQRMAPGPTVASQTMVSTPPAGSMPVSAGDPANSSAPGFSGSKWGVTDQGGQPSTSTATRIIVASVIALVLLTGGLIWWVKFRTVSAVSATHAPAVSQTPAVNQTAKINIEFVPIAPGSFTMGSPAEAVGGVDEEPRHQVTISKGFDLGKYEVTQAQWQAVMGDNPSKFKNVGGQAPVENVSWDDAQAFIAKLSALGDGYTYRLPTEAEWEYAARAGTTGPYAGNLDSMAWYGANSGNQTHSVGTKSPNAWGLYDMQGNVWEWVQDWYGSYEARAQTDPSGPSSGRNRVYRGGSFYGDTEYLRSAIREFSTPGVHESYLGFRLVRTPK